MPTVTSHANPSQLKGDLMLSWTVHLAQECRLKFFAIIMLTLALSALGYFAIGSFGAIATAVVIIASLADFLFPVKYIITTDGAECRMLLKSAQIKWDNVLTCYLDNLGVKLSPLRPESRLEAFRGVYLRFNGNAEQVKDIVKSMRDKKCSE